MVTQSPPIYPIRILREHITSLEAAITLGRADPGKEPVHRLRTSTRRIEAQLELISLLPAVPDHAKPAKKLRKVLKKLRRAAGAVRDLDVQRDLLKAEISKSLRKEKRGLRRNLKHQRADAAQELTALLQKDQQHLAPALEHLLKILEPVEGLSLSSRELSELTRTWYRKNAPDTPAGNSPDRLHAVRKLAKQARYITESGDRVLAKSFESLQQAGGTWHDLHTLAHVAAKQLGKRSALAALLAQQRDTALDVFQKSLETESGLAGAKA